MGLMLGSCCLGWVLVAALVSMIAFPVHEFLANQFEVRNIEFVCKYFMDGKCNHGDKCRYQHSAKAAAELTYPEN